MDRQKTPATPPATESSRRRAGIGAIPHDSGVAFRVWAPNAEAVAVVGSFNDWNGDANPLEREEDGCWYADVPAAKIGDEYRYRLRYRNQVFDRIDPRAREVTHSQGNGVVLDLRTAADDDDFAPAPLNALVLYELHLGTFHGRDGRCGTFDTAIDKLPHLKELGVNAVQLMPVVEFPGEESWGYNPSHPFAVESSYGGPAALRRFVQAAHREGIAVFLDVIYNHFGPGDLHLWRFDGWFENDRGGIYFYQDERADSPWGARPDYGRREVREYVIDNALMWVEEYRIDGLRVDGTYFMRAAARGEQDVEPSLPEGWSLLCELTDAVRKRAPQAVLIAEDMREDESLTRPTTDGGAGFQAQWADRFGHGLRHRADDPEGQRQALRNVADALPHRFNGDPFQRVIYIESHDNAGKGERMLDAAEPENPEGVMARRWLALVTACAFTAPGVPLMFQGQEMLAGGFSLDGCEPLDWSNAERFAGVVAYHRDLIALRRNVHGTTAGLTGSHVNVFHGNEETGILAWHRWRDGGPGDDVLVVANFSGERREGYRIGAPADGPWRVRLNSEWSGYGDDLGSVHCPDPTADADGMDDLPSRIEVSLGPWGVVVLSQE